MLRDTRRTTAPSFGNARRVFTPPVVNTTGMISVVLIQRKDTNTEDSDPRQNRRNKDGSMSEEKRQQILLELVGVVVTIGDRKVCLPDPEGQYTLPPIGSEEYNAIMGMGSGIFVEGVFGDDIARLRDAAAAGHNVGISLEILDKAVTEGNLPSALLNKAAARTLGVLSRKEWTIADIMFGGKTFNVPLLAEGMGDAYAESFRKLREQFNFPNVAFKALLGPSVSVAELNGGPSYSGQVHFMWKDGGLDPAYAFSGEAYATSGTTATSASDLARRSSDSTTTGRSNAVNTRINGYQESLNRTFKSGQEFSPVSPASNSGWGGGGL